MLEVTPEPCSFRTASHEGGCSLSVRPSRARTERFRASGVCRPLSGGFRVQALSTSMRPSGQGSGDQSFSRNRPRGVRDVFHVKHLLRAPSVTEGWLPLEVLWVDALR